MGSIIIASGTLFYSLLYFNSRLGYNGLKYSYSVISVIDNSLAGNTKKLESLRSWTIRVRFLASWAESVLDSLPKSTLQRGATRRNITLIAAYCNTLQHTAAHCNRLQHIAAHCNILQHTARNHTLFLMCKHCGWRIEYTATHCNTLHHTAPHYTTRQYTATHCNILQPTY